MQTVSVAQILEQIQRLPPEKLAVVYDFVSYLSARQEVPAALQSGQPSGAPPRCGWEGVEDDPEGLELAQMGMAEYAAGLREYEERLERGEIKWQ
jgi:hypothetical protein